MKELVSLGFSWFKFGWTIAIRETDYNQFPNDAPAHSPLRVNKILVFNIIGWSLFAITGFLLGILLTPFPIG